MKKKNQSQNILQDKSKKGKDRNWRGRKLSNVKLSKGYQKLDYKENMVQNVRQCAEVLTFLKQENGDLKLNQAWFCKNKLCPICNWRRSMKYSWQATQIVDEAMKREPKGRFLFLTLTIKNVPGRELNQAMSDLTKSFDKLFRRAKVKKNLLGFLRATEVTVEEEREGYYHPHLHILMMMKSSYFQGGEYLSQKEWTEMWQQSAKLDYTPVVNIKAVKNKKTEVFDQSGIKKAILETAKYPVKPIDFDDENLQVIDDLYKGLFRKRQLAYGGLFKKIKKELGLDDVENGELLHVDEETGEISGGQQLVAVWNWERKNYFIK
ncbi:protein rep [Lactococcus formosensis]|uniref:Protein rep n=1 Tax=Lactococcus formosensis TaxID=1281486 RepID=A0A9Q9D8B7_9LACT|nr:protein rep [Lactococcus formosensis]USJ21626.1 protein rep [Lactococcus formosensis]